MQARTCFNNVINQQFKISRKDSVKSASLKDQVEGGELSDFPTALPEEDEEIDQENAIEQLKIQCFKELYDRVSLKSKAE